MNGLPSTHQQPNAAYTGAVYYRQRSILLLAPTLVIEPQDKTYRRASIRLFLGFNQPIRLAFADGYQVQSHAMLVSEDCGLCDIYGMDSDVALLDVTAATPEFALLQKHMAGRERLELAIEDFEHLATVLIEGQNGSLQCDDVVDFMHKLIFVITGERPLPLQLDSRVIKALQLIETLPLANIDLATLSAAVNLSCDRFRHLFKDVTGCTVSQYARQTAVWRALAHIEQGSNITGAAHAVGFHDVSHLYRVYTEMFGISLSEKNNSRKFQRVRCFN